LYHLMYRHLRQSSDCDSAGRQRNAQS